jgi:hypothetical protein
MKEKRKYFEEFAIFLLIAIVTYGLVIMALMSTYDGP